MLNRPRNESNREGNRNAEEGWHIQVYRTLHVFMSGSTKATLHRPHNRQPQHTISLIPSLSFRLGYNICGDKTADKPFLNILLNVR